MCYEDEVLTVSVEMSSATKQRSLLQLHKQLGHASADRLHRLLKSSGHNDMECLTIRQKIVSEYKVCQRYKRTMAKSAVGFPLPSECNEAVDPHEVEQQACYLHHIDLFTQCRLNSKLEEEATFSCFRVTAGSSACLRWQALNTGCPSCHDPQRQTSDL